MIKARHLLRNCPLQLHHRLRIDSMPHQASIKIPATWARRVRSQAILA
jgi:hypothetical protein